MHEHGLITRLLDRALVEARARGGRLAGVRVRLGALAASTPDHFREDFAHVCVERGAGDVRLDLESAPDHPAGVEILSIEVACAAPRT
jgi:Zn finger protein HypA/HybF involved in hydrogenase expression